MKVGYDLKKDVNFNQKKDHETLELEINNFVYFFVSKFPVLKLQPEYYLIYVRSNLFGYS